MPIKRINAWLYLKVEEIEMVSYRVFAVGRNAVDGYIPEAHRCSFMSTIHIDIVSYVA